MTLFSWLARTMCLAIFVLGIGCGGKTHVVGSVADSSVGGGSGGTASAGGAVGSGGLPGQDGPMGLGGATGTSSGTATGGTTGGGGAGGTPPKDAPVGTGGIRGTGGSTGGGGARGTGGATGKGGHTGGSAGSLETGGVSGGSSGRGGQTGGSAGSAGSGGVGGTAGSTGSSVDGGWDGGGIECERRGGTCQSVPLTADAYAWCVSLSGNCQVPASAYEGALGCAASADGVIPICCLPQWEQPSGQCAASGTMACYPQIAGLPSDRYEEMCPMGWMISNATCDQAGTDCCGPPVRQPVCEPWP